MANNFWFKFYFKDWADDVKKLSLVSRGLLIELIIELEKTQGQLRLDVGLISRLSGGLTKEIEFAIAEFRRDGIFDFQIIEGEEYIISRKIQKKFRKSLIAKQNGSKGGNPALNNGQLRLTELDNQTANQNPNQTPIFNSIFNSISNTKEGGMGETMPSDSDTPTYPFLENLDNDDVGYPNQKIDNLEKFKSSSQEIELAIKIMKGYNKTVTSDEIIKMAELHDNTHKLGFPDSNYSKWRQYLGYYLEKQAKTKTMPAHNGQIPAPTSFKLDPVLAKKKPQD